MVFAGIAVDVVPLEPVVFFCVVELCAVAVADKRCARLPVCVGHRRSVRPRPTANAAIESDVIRGSPVEAVREF